MIKRFNQFLNEEVNLRYDDTFRKFLIQDESEIAKYLLRSEGSEVNVSFTNLKIDSENNDMLSFNPEDKKAPKNVFRIDPKNLSHSININYYVTDYVKDFFKENLSNYIYPTNLPTNYQNLETMELVGFFKEELGSEIITEVSNPVEEDTNNSNIYNVKSFFYVVMKDIQEVNYIFSYARFKDFFKPLDFKPKRIEKAGIGRLVNKILQATNGQFQAKELEDFINRYKSYKKWIDGDVKLEVVSGGIRKWYDEENYSKGGGSLNNSCMRHDECQDYFDIYVDNPEVCQMLILFNHNGYKIDGRALLWNLVDGRKVMDRVYTTQDHFELIFNKWAIENGYLTKKEIYQTNSGGTIQLKKRNYEPYPYLDTFYYYNPKLSQLYSHTRPGCIILNDTDGYYILCELCNGDGSISCEYCDGEGAESCDDCDGNSYIENEEGERVRCSKCGGRGSLECPRCDGSGSLDCPECI